MENQVSQRIYDAAIAVIGSVMIDPSVSGDVFAALRPSDFLAPTYRTIFEAEQQLFLAGKPIDPVAVSAIIGDEYRPVIMDVMELTPTAANCMEYVRLLKQETRLHRLRMLGDKLANAATLDEAASVLEQAGQLSASSTGMTALSLRDGFARFCERQAQPVSYIHFGFSGIDQLVYAELGDYVLLGARPSTGKTMLALQVAAYLSKTYRVGFFSLETKDDKLIDRSMAHLFGMNYGKIKRHALDQADWRMIAAQKGRLSQSNLDIIQATGRTAEEIASFARYKRYQVVIVDYIQIVRTAHKGYSRENDVASISNTLANFARDHKVMVLALAQLTRDQEDQKSKTVRAPTLASFRESGSLEQDADIAMLMYLSEPDNRASDRVLRLAKNKEGQVGKVMLAFHGDKQTFTERVIDGNTFRHVSDKAPEVGKPDTWQDVSLAQIPFPEFQQGGKHAQTQRM